MVDMYIQLIIGTEHWNLSRVPAKFRNDVKAELTKQNYDDNGNKVA